jgi:PAS domain S-box-containing protein
MATALLEASPSVTPGPAEPAPLVLPEGSQAGGGHQDLLDALPGHVALLDSQGLITSVNAAWRRFAQENDGDAACLPGVNYLDACSRAVSSTDSLEANAALGGIRAVLAGVREYFSMRYRCDSPNEARWFVMRVAPLGRRPPGVLVSHEWITTAGQAELRLRESEGNFRQLFEAHQTMMLLVDPATGAIVDGNAAAASFYDCDRATLRSRSVLQLNLLERQVLEAGLKSPRSTTSTSVYRRPDGASRTLEVSSSSVKVDSRMLLYCVLQDVTSQRRGQVLFNASPDGLHLLDQAGLLVEANEAFLRMIGQPRTAVGCLPITAWEPGLGPDSASPTLRGRLDHPGLLRTRYRRLDGAVLEVELHTSVLELAGARHLLVASRDVSGRSPPTAISTAI